MEKERIPYYGITSLCGMAGIVGTMLATAFVRPTPGWLILVLMAIPIICNIYWVGYEVKTGERYRFKRHNFTLVFICIVAVLFYITFTKPFFIAS